MSAIYLTRGHGSLSIFTHEAHVPGRLAYLSGKRPGAGWLTKTVRCDRQQAPCFFAPISGTRVYGERHPWAKGFARLLDEYSRRTTDSFL